MPKKMKTVPAKDRVVYEVTAGSSMRRVEAASTSELRDQLAAVLPEVEPYALQAVARLASIERASVSTADWSVRRVGVLAFQLDVPPAARPKTAPKVERIPTPLEVLETFSPQLDRTIQTSRSDGPQTPVVSEATLWEAT